MITIYKEIINRIQHPYESSKQIKLSGHHLRNFMHYYKRLKEEKVDKETYSLGIRLYGKKTVNAANKLFSKMFSNPELKVLLVYGGDDVCKLCHFVDSSTGNCSWYLNYLDVVENEDKKAINEFGLRMGEVYSISDLIQIFDKIKKSS